MSSRIPLSPRKESLLNSRTPSPTKSNSPSGKNSPTKTNPFTALLVRLPKIGVDLTPRKASSLGFTIYEDSPEEAMRYKVQTSELANASDDKENILQPKKMEPKQALRPRKPLGNLNVDDFPGYVSAVGSIRRAPVRLRELYHSKTYNNESKSLHKYNRLPSYITPPRNSLQKILYCGGTDEDDIERRLTLKLRELARRKRLLSVGFNKGKQHLVTKNLFKIST
ncbi:hypothetical protein C7M61_004366 [Candidozyma pseudohaemuli]|uniref:Uncharacterized protein n=1 Tax=Candidozyma pseudohaemuli TaxID=418784 RepID=A0A2P7YI11_9ASCO|nr:hypothetical protein C7M61_004366 [[Candida] pseudohaemulonii]PSK35577.1 hypothetical protein C7M61_004366 [[Candida] pseudohaemulonii]